MAKFPLDLGQFSKIKDEKDHVVLRHPHGHEFKVAKKALSPKMRSDIEAIPAMAEGGNPKLQQAYKKMADGGDIEDDDTQSQTQESNPDLYRKMDPEKVKKLQGSSIFNPSGKKPKAYAEGGEVPKKHVDYEELNPPILADSVKSSKKLDIEPIKPLDIEQIPEKASSDDKKQHLAEGGEAEVPEQPKGPVVINIGNPNDAKMNPQMLNTQNQIPRQDEQQPEVSGQKTPEPGQSVSQSSVSGQQATPQQPVPQVPAAPEPRQPTIMGGYEKQQTGIQQESEAQQQQAKQASEALKTQLAAVNKTAEDYQTHYQDLDNERKAFQQDITDKHIDPNHYLGSMDAGQRMQTSIGLILGGLGGGGQGNQALDFLNRQIDRDISAQQADLGKKETLLSANLRQFGNLKDATDMTKVMQNDILITKLKQAEATAQSPMAKARALQLSGQLESQQAPIVQQLATRRMLQGVQQPGGSNPLSKVDPAAFVPSVVPADRQKDVFGEIERAQDTRRMGDTILKSFDQAAHDNTVLKTGAGLVRTPASVYALHQSMQPTFKDLEGTVRQAAMDNTFTNITPRPGDTRATINTKRDALVDYLKSKVSAPQAKAYGIDLDKFQTTSQNPEIKLTPQQQSFVKFARENPNDPRSAMILNKLGIK